MMAQHQQQQQLVLKSLSEEMAKRVVLIMNPNTPQVSRAKAYDDCEQFKAENRMCAQVGLYLSNEKNSSQIVKHFGLQLIEHTIRFKWNSITQEEKIFIKENAMKLLMNGVGPVDDLTLSPLKDALSRIIVEMIKREWPQQWSLLLTELSEASTKGESQTELVLLIFLRLVEDVALLQTIESNQRRKDLYQALTNNMSDIFEFLSRLIEMHVLNFREATLRGNYTQANIHSRVVEVALLTLSAFVEWVSISHITQNNGKLLHILCVLLNDKAFQCNAAECLSLITNRKGQIRERKPLLILLTEQPLRYVYTACQQPDGLLSASIFEQNHNFLKKMNSILYGLTLQLSLIWGKDDAGANRPAHFEIFLECILKLLSHSSLTIAHGAALIWNMLLKHDSISKDVAVISYIPKVIDTIAPKIVKVFYPKQRQVTANVSLESYICLEYDCDEEFAVFFHRCRMDFLEIFRYATLIQPLVTFAYCEHWLILRLKNASLERGNENCSIEDPIYLEWEALVSIMDGVLTRLLSVSERPSVQSGLHLLEECLKVETENPLILSIILSCLSALFVFLSMSSCQITPNNCVTISGVTLLSRVLERIFTALIFKDTSEHSQTLPRIQAFKNLRRHAASLMVKLGHKYPLLLLPVFDQINASVKTLSQQTDIPLAQMERINLQEALILISNHFCDYDRQSVFIGDILKEGLSHWTAFSHAFKSAFDFIRFVGLDKSPVERWEDDPHAANRIRIHENLYIVLGAIKRCIWPEDPDRAQRGGFIVGLTEHGNPIFRNPASPHIIPLLPHILALLRVLNELFKPEALAALSRGYKDVHTMLEHEKKMLMGIMSAPTDPLDPNVKKSKTSFDKMQNFMTQLFEGCYHMMGTIGPSLRRDVYQLQGIAEALINSAFASLNDVPDSRLRPIIRVFFKPFIYTCPPTYYDTVLMPMFIHLIPIMYDRLIARWTYITSLYESGQLNEEINDTQEVLEDMLNRTLTREYLDVFKIALIGGQIGAENVTSNASIGNAIVDVAMESVEEHSMDGTTHSRTAQSALLSDIISDLGAKLLRTPQTSNFILFTLIRALSWNDSSCNIKAIIIIAPVLRFLAAEQLLDAQRAVFAFKAVLDGLKVHGQHEANQAGLITLGVQFYELLRPKFHQLLEVLQSLPSVHLSDIQKFEEKISTAPIKGNKVEKGKKDLFKKLTAGVIGCSGIQPYRNEIIIANLPPIPPSNSSTVQNTSIIENENVDLAELFRI